MAHSTITAFESTVHKTNRWIHEVMRETHTDDPQKAYHALVSVLRAVRDRLGVVEVAHLAAQLPMLLRGAYYEDWRPSCVREKQHTREEFLEHICRDFPNDMEIGAAKVATGVFRVLSGNVSAGEIADIKSVLPREVRGLWPSKRS